jgi:excisionase family DNA binding protein
MALEPMIDICDVAELCRVSRNAVRELVRTGQIRAVKLGPRMVRFRRSDVERFLTEHATVQGHEHHAR